MLIAMGSEVDMKSLHEAVEYGESFDVFKILLESGTDPNSKDNEGKTSLDLARTKDVGAVLQESQKEREEKSKTDERQVFNYSLCFKQILDPFTHREIIVS
jgi:hypothetical protein